MMKSKEFTDRVQGLLNDFINGASDEKEFKVGILDLLIKVRDEINSLTENKYQALIMMEYIKASRKFGKFNSGHEGYAVIKEEVDELWDAIKKNDLEHAREEAFQVGAMALRFLIDTDKNFTGL